MTLRENSSTAAAFRSTSGWRNSSKASAKISKPDGPKLEFRHSTRCTSKTWISTLMSLENFWSEFRWRSKANWNLLFNFVQSWHPPDRRVSDKSIWKRVSIWSTLKTSISKFLVFTPQPSWLSIAWNLSVSTNPILAVCTARAPSTWFSTKSPSTFYSKCSRNPTTLWRLKRFTSASTSEKLNRISKDSACWEIPSWTSPLKLRFQPSSTRPTKSSICFSRSSFFQSTQHSLNSHYLVSWSQSSNTFKAYTKVQK